MQEENPQIVDYLLDGDCIMLGNKELFLKIKSMFSGISQKEIAEKLNISTSLVNKWSKGESKPSFDILNFIVDKTGCSWDELLTGKSATSTADNDKDLQSQIDSLKAQIMELRQDKRNMQEHIDLLKEKLEGRSENSDLAKINQEGPADIEHRRANKNPDEAAG